MNETIAPVKFGIGASVKRVEDMNLITGHGTYVGDITPAGTVIGYVLRSAMAHARFTLEGVEDARAADGVLLVWTADDIDELGHIPTKGLVKQVDGSS
jgi:aerobic carbon-monoxide dehydrogenase large subunit